MMVLAIDRQDLHPHKEIVFVFHLKSCIADPTLKMRTQIGPTITLVTVTEVVRLLPKSASA